MGHTETSTDLLILGVHVRSEGYPNTLYRLEDLEASGLFRIAEINAPMLAAVGTNRHRLIDSLARFWRILSAHLVVLGRYLSGTYPRLAYIPYPAVFVLFLLSLLPKSRRPRRIVADAFISIYDTVVLDRKLLRAGSLPARILKRIERRAYALADTVVVDTAQNATFLSQLFHLEQGRFLDIPLSSNEKQFRHVPYLPRQGVCRVLFVGTLIPLHGIAVIMEAAQLLAARADIHIKVIGNGQDGTFIESYLGRGSTRVEWVTDWQTSKQLADEIAASDICLGIFGGGDKTQRVCPLKIYAYACVGRAIITGETRWENEATEQLAYKPFSTVSVDNAPALAGKIGWLADNPTLRAEMAGKSRRFYTEHLSNLAAMEKFSACLREG